MAATVRLGTCSFADEGLVKAWYPRGVSTSQRRLQYYSERFDTVEVDSPYYHLPDPGVTRNWAQRTPPEFTFHVKAHKTMTGHEGEPDDAAFAAFRESIEPLELSGKLRAILLQYHPRFVKSAEALAELERVRPRIAPARPARRVPTPIVDGAGRARRHARIPRAQRPRVRVRRHPDDACVQRGRTPRGRDASGRVRALPRPEREDVEHQGREVVRAVRLDVLRGGARRMGREARPPLVGGRRGVCAVQQQPRRLRAAERDDPARAPRRGRNPLRRRHRAATPGRRRSSEYSRAVRVLSVTHGPTVPGGVFDEAVEAAGHTLERWQVPDGARPRPRRRITTPSWSSAGPCIRTRTTASTGSERGAVPRRRARGAGPGLRRLPGRADARSGCRRRCPTRECPGDRLARRRAHRRRAPPIPCSARFRRRRPSSSGITTRSTSRRTESSSRAAAICTQAFRLSGRRAWGIQFHAEVTLAMVTAWTRRTRTSSRCRRGTASESESSIARSNEQGHALAEAFLREGPSLADAASTRCGCRAAPSGISRDRRPRSGASRPPRATTRARSPRSCGRL